MPSFSRPKKLIAAGVVASICVLACRAAGRQPNVIILLADDMGLIDGGVLGSTDIPTPNIDRLARNGVRFSNAYTSGCVCSPTRAGLMTGRYQQRFGFDANAEGKALPADRGARGLDLAQTTFAQRMKALGYATAIFGKWHLGDAPGYLPTDRGFDEFYGFLPFGLGANKPAGPVLYRGTEPVSERPENHMEQFCREAVGFIERNRSKPFLLYLPFPAVHGPYVSPEPWFSRLAGVQPEGRRKYAADLAQMDDVIGRVMARLGELGLEQDTLVFFLGDNGGPGGAARNGVLRGVKWTLWEGGVRVPLIVQWKGRIPADQVVDHPVIQLDLLPTAIAAAGGAIVPDWQLDGVNLLPTLDGSGREPPHASLYWRFGVQYAVRQGPWKLVKPHLDSSPRLFHLPSDPGEQADLAASEPERVRVMQAAWDGWNARNEPPRWIDHRWNGDGPQAARAVPHG